MARPWLRLCLALIVTLLLPGLVIAQGTPRMPVPLTATQDGTLAAPSGAFQNAQQRGFYNDLTNKRFAITEGLSLAGGQLVLTALGTPSAPTITHAGAAGIQTWTYKVVATNGSGVTAASAAGSTTTGNATLTTTNYNIVTWPAVTGATGYQVYRTVSGGTPATTGLIATVTLGSILSTNDTGQAGDASSAPTTNTTGCEVIGAPTGGCKGSGSLNAEALYVGGAAVAVGSGGTFTSPHMATSVIFDQAAGNYTLTWANPGAARAISFTDPGGTDSFVWLAATQAVTGKTYNGLTVSTTTGTFTLTNAKTLTVSDSTTLATNAITLGGGEVITFSATNALSLLTTGGTSVTLPLTGTLATLAGAEELTNKTLTSGVGKGTWTASGTWTLPAFTLGGTVSGGGQQLNNIIIGTSTPLAGTFTTLVGTGGTHTGITSFGIRDTTAAFDVTLAATSTSATLTAGRILTLDMGNVAHTVALGTTANTITFPNAASGTVPLLNLAQSFTAAQTFAALTTVSNARLALVGDSSGFQMYMNYKSGDGVVYVGATDSATPDLVIYNTGTAELARFKTGGTFTITGTLTATAIASNTGAQTGYLCYNTGAPGTITYDGTNTCLVSLEEYKNNVGPITHASAIIDQLQPFWGSYKEGTPMSDHRVQPFLGARQVESVDKRLVTYSDEGNLKGVRYMNLTAVLVADMQEQHKTIERLHARMLKLEGLHDH